MPTMTCNVTVATSIKESFIQFDGIPLVLGAESKDVGRLKLSELI